MKILSDKEYKDMEGRASMLEHHNKQLARDLAEARRHPRRVITETQIVQEVKDVTKVRIEQAVFDALAKELPKPCVPKSELEAGVLLGVQMVLEKIRQGWVV